MQGKNPPRNCISAFSVEGDQIFTNRSYTADQTRANFLSKDVEEGIRSVGMCIVFKEVAFQSIWEWPSAMLFFQTPEEGDGDPESSGSSHSAANKNVRQEPQWKPRSAEKNPDRAEDDRGTTFIKYLEQVWHIKFIHLRCIGCKKKKKILPLLKI